MAQLTDELMSSDVARDYLRLKMDESLKQKMIDKYSIMEEYNNEMHHEYMNTLKANHININELPNQYRD